LISGPLPEPPLQAQPILAALLRHGVDFVLIGGLAGLAHGSSYPTYDLDVAYSRDAGNLERLTSALRELDVTLRGAPSELPFQLDARSLANGANFTFETKYGWFDILADVAGISSYEQLLAEARTVSVEGSEVRVASIDHLIAMKRASNRTKDKLMLEEYIVLADEQQRSERQ
jgi:predicted nucleotidyltransferase